MGSCWRRTSAGRTWHGTWPRSGRALVVKELRAPGFLDRVVSAGPLLAGVIFSFLGCCLVGRFVSQKNPYKWFTRFHRYVHPETHVYPTASQVRALARERLDP